MRRRVVGAVAAGLATAGLLAGAYAVSDTLQVRSTARTFMIGVRQLDCGQVGRVSVWTDGRRCSAEALGFDSAVDGYRMTLDRVDPSDDQAAVGIRLPGEPRSYSLHLVRHDGGWIVDAIDATT